jgi:hypothetical protein
MSQQYPGSAGSSGTPRPDGGQAQTPAGAPPPWPEPPPPGPWPPPPGGQDGPRRSHIQPVTAGVAAVLAALVVAIVVLFAVTGHSAAPASAAGGGNAPAGGGAPVQGGGGGFYGGGGGGGGNHLVMGGQVTRVSSTSITLGGQGHTITAAITSATRYTGSVKSASGIKPGQSVMVVISGYGSAHPVAQSISDPPSAP